MKFLKRGVALALLAAFTLAGQPAQAYEKDKTYKITILHTNDHHGHFWRSEYGEYGLAAQKTLVDGIRKEVAEREYEILRRLQKLELPTVTPIAVVIGLSCILSQRDVC